MLDETAVAAPHLLNRAELTNLGGAVTAVVLVANGLHYAFGWNPRWTGLIMSVATAATAASLNQHAIWQDWVLVVPNTFAIYLSAVGATGMIAPVVGSARPTHGGVAEELTIPRSPYFVAWY